jgi:hypothetical protein
MATRPAKPTRAPRSGYEWYFNTSTNKWAQKKKATTQKQTYADYGYVNAFLKAHPDVKKKVDAAIKQGWTPQRLEGEVKTTNWWKNRNESQRKWDLLSAEQAGEKTRLLDAEKRRIENAASRMGVTLSSTQINDFALQSLRDGKSDAEITLGMANKFVLPTDNKATPGVDESDLMKGQAGTTVTEIRDLASAYGVKVSDTNLLKWTRSALAGDIQVEELEDTFRESAKALYPPIADVLDQGQTLEGFVSPYLDIAARELGITRDMMDLTDSKWTGMIESAGVLPADQWTTKIRSDKRYGWNTSTTAKREAVSLVSSLGSIFGGA